MTDGFNSANIFIKISNSRFKKFKFVTLLFITFTFGVLNVLWYKDSYFKPFMVEETRYMELSNLKNFSFLLNNENLCQEKGQVDIIFIVPSHPLHSDIRTTLRKTYNRIITIPGTHITRFRAVFLMGKMNSHRLQDKIDKEFHQHKDIVQGNFPDSYDSISYNHLQGLLWAHMHCSTAKYIIKVDDDMFVNIYKLIQILFENYSILRNKLVCAVWTNAIVKRDPQDKYYMSREDYRNDTYPTYCNGWLVAYSNQVATAILEKSSTVPFFWMSDVYITGILAQEAQLSFFDINDYNTYDEMIVSKWLREGFNLPHFLVGPSKNMLHELHNKSDKFYSFKQL